MRPRGAARMELVSALHAEGGGGLVDLVARTGLPYAKVRQVMADCVRAGDVTYKLERRAHARRPIAVYEPAVERAEPAPVAPWQGLLAAWHG